MRFKRRQGLLNGTPMMPISDYHKQILDTRDLLTGNLLPAAQKRMLNDLRFLDSQIQELLRDATGKDDKLSRRLWRDKQAEVRRLIDEYAAKLKREVERTPRDAAEQVTDIREAATRELLAENGVNVRIDFSGVPQRSMEFLAARQDVEGLKFSANVWGDAQATTLLTDINRQLATKSVREIAVGVRQFVRGSDALTDSELADLRTVRGRERRKLGHSIKYKAERLIRTEVAQAHWEAGRLSAEESPIVQGIKWNLSARHPHWDVCDILSEQDLYGLGAGVYPADKIPPRPHPNDLCFQTDVLRDMNDWDKPKLLNTELAVDVDEIPRGGQGTDRHIEKQWELATGLIKAVA